MLILLLLIIFFEDYHNEGVSQRIDIISKIMVYHNKKHEIDNNGYLFYIDPSEYIPQNNTLPQLGQRVGDDISISKQRIMYEIVYKIKDDKISYNVVASYPVRTAKVGFGFNRKSGKTPTGLYKLMYPIIAEERYLSLSYKFPRDITTARIPIINITRNGRSIYSETRGYNNPFLRGILIHGFGISSEDERNRDLGSKGCVHTVADGIIEIATLVNRDIPVYIFISGSKVDFSDLPLYERTIFESFKSI